MTGLMPSCIPIFHMNYEETESCIAEFGRAGGAGQLQINLRLLISCGKLQNSVHDCGK